MTFEAITSYSMDDSMSLNYVYSITLVLMSELSNSSLEIRSEVQSSVSSDCALYLPTQYGLTMD